MSPARMRKEVTGAFQCMTKKPFLGRRGTHRLGISVGEGSSLPNQCLSFLGSSLTPLASVCERMEEFSVNPSFQARSSVVQRVG